MGLHLSPDKTRIVHLDEGFDFLGFRILRRRKKGTVDIWHVYTFIGDRALRSLRDKIRALTHRLSQVPHRDVLNRINQIPRGWACRDPKLLARLLTCGFWTSRSSSCCPLVFIDEPAEDSAPSYPSGHKIGGEGSRSDFAGARRW